jgi:2-C-methyl-D-erythritol 2,4-cyclodiphosphate synthase
MRVGIGYDVHPLTTGHPLILGGLDIPFDKGLEGWSDGDVLIHAVIDALLGAAALGDIGSHFPSGNPEFKNIDSLILLNRVEYEINKEGWQISNVDATVIAEAPRLREYIDDMRHRLSDAMDIEFNQVSIKATTSEHMGFVGRGEGIAVYAVALLEKKPKRSRGKNEST